MKELLLLSLILLNNAAHAKGDYIEIGVKDLGVWGYSNSTYNYDSF